MEHTTTPWARQHRWPSLPQTAAALLLGGAVLGAAAHPQIDIFSGICSVASSIDPTVAGACWEASTDQIQWSSVVSPYPNQFTRPDYTQTQAQLMWAAQPGVTPDGTNGPDHVWFRFRFTLGQVTHNDWDTFSAEIAADDWMRVLFNGTEIGSYLLPENKVNGQPVTKVIRFTPLATGINEILIEAKDLGPSGCAPYACAGNEWVFFDGDPGTAPGQVSPFLALPPAVPEPASLALVLLAGLLGTVASRRR